MNDMNRNGNKNGPDQNRQRARLALTVLIMIGLFFLSGPLMSELLGFGAKEVPYNEFLDAVDK